MSSSLPGLILKIILHCLHLLTTGHERGRRVGGGGGEAVQEADSDEH